MINSKEIINPDRKAETT